MRGKHSIPELPCTSFISILKPIPFAGIFVTLEDSNGSAERGFSQPPLIGPATFAISLAGSSLEPPTYLPQLPSLKVSSLGMGGCFTHQQAHLPCSLTTPNPFGSPRHHQDYPNSHMTPIHILQTWDIGSPVFIACLPLPARGGSCPLALHTTVVYFPGGFQEPHLDL